MKATFRLFLPLLLPILISVLPMIILREERSRARDLAFEQMKRSYQRHASLIAQELRSNCTMEMQIQNQASLMKTLLVDTIRQNASAEGQLSATDFLRCFRRAFPTRRHPNGKAYWNPASETLFLAFQPDGPEKVKAVPTSTLPGYRLRLFTRLVNEMLLAPQLSTKELKDRDALSKGLFGKYCKFEMISLFRKGMAAPIHYLDHRSFCLWDTIEYGGKRLGAYLMIFPESMETKGRPLRYALETAALNQRTAWFPVLIPLERTAVPLRPMIPYGVQTPEFVDPLTQKVFRDSRSQIASISVTAFYSTFSVHRDVIRGDVPYELWLWGPPLPRQLQTFIDRIGFFLFCWFGGIWVILFVRTLQTGQQLPLGLRTWLFAFFTLIGAIPLSVLYFSGSSRIQTEMQRKIEATIRETGQELESIDAGSRHLFNTWVDKCRTLFRDVSWVSNLLSKERADIDAAWQKTKQVMGNDGIDHVLISRFGIGPEILPPIWDKTADIYQHGLAKTSFPALYPFVSFCAIYLEPRAEKKYFFEGFSDTIKSAATIYDQTVDRNAKKDFLLVRGTGDPMSIGNNLVFQFHDSITQNGHLAGWVVMRRRAIDSQKRYLAETVTQMHLQDRDRIFSFGRIRPGSVEFLGSNHVIANQQEMAFFRNFMGLAARSRSKQVQIMGRKAYFAHAGIQMPAYVLGAIVDLHRLYSDAQEQRESLSLWTLFLFLPVVFIAWGVATYIVQPLLGIEQALTRVQGGNLQVRTQIDREDELGEMSLAFDQMIRGLEKRKRLEAFVSGALSEDLATGTEDTLSAPSIRQGAVLVSDLRSFTTLSETYPARKVVAMLNRHLEVMSSIIKSGGGLIDKFIGDAIVAVFYDRPQESGVKQAIRAALEMNHQHRLIQQARQLQGDFTYRMGVGIDCGALMVGTIRSPGRHEHTVMGDARHNADILESSSRHGRYTRIVLSTEACNMFREGEFQKLAEGDGYELIGLKEPET